MTGLLVGLALLVAAVGWGVALGQHCRAQQMRDDMETLRATCAQRVLDAQKLGESA